MCQICGQPNYVRCNCVSAQPFCNQCDQNTNCTSITDSQCVIYHFAYPGYIPPPTRLINLGMPNGSSAEAIFEKIDTFFGAGFFRPWTTGNTNTLNLHLDGPGLPVVLRGDVNISPTSGNTLVALSDGLFVPSFNPDYKVKVDATAPPRYLFDSMVGGTDGCVSITVNDMGGLINIQPFLDIQCFTDRICDQSGTTKAQLGACLLNSALTVLDTPSIDLTLTPILNGVELSANSKISAAANNTIVINSDGLYASGGTGVTADNGLTISSPGNVQLGGTLLHDTTIDFSNFTLNLINSPKVSGLNTSTTNDFPFNFVTQRDLGSTGCGTLTGFMIFTNSTNFIQPNSVSTFANDGQLFFTNTGNITLHSGANLVMSGIYGAAVIEGSGSITGNIIAGGQFQGGAKGTSNVDKMAAVLVQGLGNVDGTPYTGTVTDFYGLYIRDINTSDFAARITNKHAIYQAGATDTVQFNGIVTATNGSNSITTSDQRIKENITPLQKGLKEIEQLNIYEFNYIYDKKQKTYGVVAQELKEIMPEAVRQMYIKTPDEKEYDDLHMIQENKLFYTMLNAIKELSAKVKALENK